MIVELAPFVPGTSRWIQTVYRYIGYNSTHMPELNHEEIAGNSMCCGTVISGFCV